MRLSRRYLVVPFLALALVIPASLADKAVAQGAPVTVQLSPQNNSGISGTAVLTPMDQQTKVVVTLTGAGTGPEPNHIHMGTCANLTPQPAFPLTPVNNGSGETILSVPLSQIQGSQMAVNVHKSPTEVAVYVACGNIPLAAQAAPSPAPAAAPAAPAPAPAVAPAAAPAPTAAPATQPAQLPRTGQAEFGLYGLLALGGLLLLAGVGLVVRRRSI